MAGEIALFRGGTQLAVLKVFAGTSDAVLKETIATACGIPPSQPFVLREHDGKSICPVTASMRGQFDVDVMTKGPGQNAALHTSNHDTRHDLLSPVSSLCRISFGERSSHTYASRRLPAAARRLPAATRFAARRLQAAARRLHTAARRLPAATRFPARRLPADARRQPDTVGTHGRGARKSRQFTA